MHIQPINPKRTYKSIIEQLVGLIKSEELKKGDRLPGERTLADMFNVSRASVREALSAMEIIGLIDVRQGEGSFVTDLNIAPFINTIAPLFIKNESMESELLAFRKMLELEAVRLAAGKAGEEKISLLEESVDHMKMALDRDDYAAGAQADIDFHKTIFSMTDNFILIKSAECIAYILESSIQFNRQKILNTGNNGAELCNQHVSILEAIREKNPGLAVDRMDKHLSFVLAVG